MKKYYWELNVDDLDAPVAAGSGSEDFESDEAAKEAICSRYPDTLIVLYTERNDGSFRIIYENLASLLRSLN